MQVALIGFGEAGQAFATGWQQEGLPPPLAFDAHDLPRVSGAHLTGRGEALAGAEVVFCLVTADQALTAARECARHLAPGTLWFDGNSCAPETKRVAADVIGLAGADYVDMAVMAPVYPRLHKTPMLISGPAAPRAAIVLAAIGMQARVVGEAVGVASSVKMLRSVMVKGMEALYAECFLAARKAGVEAEVIGSLIASDPEIDWLGKGAYNLERMMAHGIRRAAEMRQVVVTLRDLGFAADMTAAVAEWQQRIGDLGLKDAEGDLWQRADMALALL